MRVDLGRGDVGVAQELLYAAQILTRFKQMRGEGMTEQVRIDASRQPLAACPLSDAQLDRPRLQSRAVASDEKGGFIEGRERCALLEPAADGVACLAADGHDARLGALAEPAHGAIGEIDV